MKRAIDVHNIVAAHKTGLEPAENVQLCILPQNLLCNYPTSAARVTVVTVVCRSVCYVRALRVWEDLAF